MSTRPSALRRVPWSLALAIVLAGAFGVLHVLGLREHVSVLSGTPVPGVPVERAAITGGLYVLAYFGAVLVAPILALAAALSALLSRVAR